MANPSISKLVSPLKDLVLGVTPELGKTDKDKAEVIEWIEKIAQGDIIKPEGVKVWKIININLGHRVILSKDLDIQFVPRTYAVANYLTAADVVLYGALHPILVRILSFFFLLICSSLLYVNHSLSSNLHSTTYILH